MKQRPRLGDIAHYRNGAYYEQAYRQRRSDVRFYTTLAQKHGGPVLELGAGTGRVTRAIAKAGIDVVAVERMEEMLAHAKERAAKLPSAACSHIEWRKGDLRSVRLKRRFPLVIAPFNVWMHLHTRVELERAFATVRAHLRRDGRFVFDVMLPNPACLARDPQRAYRGGSVPVPGDTTRYRYSEHFDYDPVQQVQTSLLVFTHPSDPRRSFSTPLSQRQFFPAELRALLHYNHFRVLSHNGDFKGGRLQAESESQVLVTRATR